MFNLFNYKKWPISRKVNIIDGLRLTGKFDYRNRLSISTCTTKWIPLIRTHIIKLRWIRFTGV